MATDDQTPRPGDPTPVRIGDAERQRMTDLLQRHMAAGRLDMPEYERRVEHATSAVYEQDLAGLLDDLPPLDDDGEPVARAHRAGRATVDDGVAWEQPSWWPPRAAGRGGPRWGRRLPFPLLALGAIALVVATHGWILFPLLFLFFFARGGGCSPRYRERTEAHDRRVHRQADRDGAVADGEDLGPQWPGRFEPFGDDRRM